MRPSSSPEARWHHAAAIQASEFSCSPDQGVSVGTTSWEWSQPGGLPGHGQSLWERASTLHYTDVWGPFDSIEEVQVPVPCNIPWPV